MKVNKNFQKMRQTNQATKKVNNKHKSKIRNSNNWDPALANSGQFRMKFHASCRVLLSLFFLLQLSEAGEKDQEKLALFMQRNVEQLIEKILSQVQEFYHEIKSNSKCIPDYVPDNIMMTLKKSIDCVSENEKNYIVGKIRRKAHMKNFLNCFSQAKREVNETMMAIDPEEDYCPENATEKTYQINVTTTFVKTFQISISNGLEVTHKEIDFSKDNCVDKNSIKNENEDVDNTTPSIYSPSADDFEKTSDASAQNEDFDSTTGYESNHSFDDEEDGSTHHETDDSFDVSVITPQEDNDSPTDDTTLDDEGSPTDDTTQDDEDNPTDVQSTIHPPSTYIHSGKPFSTQNIDGFTEIYNYNGNKIVIHEDQSNQGEPEEMTQYEESQYENNPEEDSLNEYALDYDNPEENEEDALNEYEESNSGDYNMGSDEEEGKPAQRNATKLIEEKDFDNSDELYPQKKSVLTNVGRKNLASDIYAVKKLREDDDYYDIKNGGKLDFRPDNEGSDDEKKGKNDKKKRRTKIHPKALKYVSDESFIIDS